MAEIENNLCLEQILINNLLDYSSYFNNEIKLDRNRFILQDVVKSCQQLYDSQLKFKGVTFSVHYESIVDNIEVINDQSKILRVLVNLVSNSLKHTNKNGFIKLTISRAYKIQFPNQIDLINFQLEDSGIGMNQNKLE